jgi:peptidyl-prolyl cis-trans isomerase C
VASVFGLLVAGAALAQPAAGGPAAKVVTVVNGVAITAGELEKVLEAAGQQPVPQPEAQRRVRQMEALAMLIENVLMRQFLEKQTRPVPQEEVGRRLNEMGAGLKEQGKSLEEFCRDTNQTMEQLKANVAEHLRWSAYVSANLTDTALEAYYKENKDFFDGVTVEASHIVKRLPATATETERARARAKLEQIRQQLLSDPKADFAELAKQHSEDPQASKGGYLGFIPRKWFDEAFSKAAFALPVGQVSEVVQTDYGLHLIKVTSRKPGTPSDYAKIKEAVREFCAEDMRQQILAKERKEAKITPPELP